jgi:hypothetical protein
MIRTPYTSDHYLELACRNTDGQGFICLLLYAIVLLFAFCLITIYLFVTILWPNYYGLLVGGTANKDFLFARETYLSDRKSRCLCWKFDWEVVCFSMNQRVPRRVTASPWAAFASSITSPMARGQDETPS